MSAFTVLTGKLTGNIYLGRPRRRWGYNIRMDLIQTKFWFNQSLTVIILNYTHISLFFFRMKATLYCLMNLQKFPFDQQQCPLVLESCEFTVY